MPLSNEPPTSSSKGDLRQRPRKGVNRSFRAPRKVPSVNDFLQFRKYINISYMALIHMVVEMDNQSLSGGLEKGKSVFLALWR